LFIGSAVTLFGVLTGEIPGGLYVFAGLLVLVGVGLRLEATIRDRLRKIDNAS
jgi:hypothetical protein